MDEDRDMETQKFDDTQSDHILNVWTGNEANEDRSTEPFGDTIALESPSEETQLENIDNELLDIPDSVDGIATQIVDDYEEVVLDSDDEGVHKTETACSKGLTSSELKRKAVGDVLDTPCVCSEDFVVGSIASSHKQCHAVYKRRRVFSVYPQTVQGAGLGRGSMSDHASSIGPSSIHSDACSQEQLVIKCDVPSSRKDSTLLTSEHETAKLRYNQYEEPGESSQDNALGFVDQYLSFNKVNLSEEVGQKKTSRQKSPPVLCAKGAQILARRAILGTTYGMSGTFEWDANEIHDREGDPLEERKKSISNGEGPETTSVTRCLGDRNLDVQSQMILRNQSKEKFQGEMIDADCINSSLTVLHSQEVGDVVQASGVKFVKEMDDQLNAEASEQQLEAGSPGMEVPDTFDVGFDTQMAAEAMEALFYAPPPNSNIHSTPQDQENIVEDSSKDSTGKCSFSKICSNSGVTARKLMPKNKPLKKLSGKTLRPFRENKRSRKDLDHELPEANKVKRGKSLCENPFKSGNPSNAKKHSHRSSFTSIDQRQAETVLERDNNKVDNNLVSSTFVEPYSLGEGPLQGKRGMFSPLAHRNRSWSSVLPLEESKDPTTNSKQRMSTVMEAGVLKKRRKNCHGNDAFQVLSLQGKQPNMSLRTSEEAKDVKVSQQAENELDVAPAGSHLKFTAWRYPRGKRTHRNVPCHSKGVSDICPPSALVKGEKGGGDSMDIRKKSQANSETICYSTESQKNSQRNSETSCFSFYVRRKRRSSACAHQLQASTTKQCEEKSGELDHVVFSSSAESQKNSQKNSETSCFSFYVRRKRRSSACAHQLQASKTKQCEEKSGELDHVVFSPSGNGANESINVLNLNADLSLSKCPSPVNFTKGINLVPAILNANEKSNQLLNRKLSRFPPTKELISLRFSGSLPNFTSKALRRRRDMANVRVLFSHNLDEDIIKQQKKILVRLGSSVASCCADATHFIADRFVRTRNMLESIALGKPVVTQLWLDSCGQASCFIDEKNYILRDAKKEKEIGFSMPVSLGHSRQHPLLKGCRVIVTPNIRPSNELIVSLVKAVHGQVVDRMEAAMTNETIPVDVLILSCDQDYELCAPFLNKGAAVYSSELLLNGIIIQKLEFERHRLFKNHLKRNNSRIGLEKDGDQYLPVAMC